MPVVRNGTREIKFEGELVASVSSELPSKDRWTEFEIWLTSPHKEWILATVGKSRVDGEKDRHWSVISDDPAAIIDAIAGREMSRLAKQLLSDTLAYLRDCD